MVPRFLIGVKNKKAPLISVVMPSYNAEAYIKSAVLSIVNQTIPDWELIIVDDASQDNTVQVIKSIDDPRIKLIEQPSNQGYPFAMNKGVSAASGKYIARMDADDVSAPSRLEEQVKALEGNPQAAFCGVARYQITPGGKMYVDKIQPATYCKAESWGDLLQNKRIFTDPSVMAEKERILAVGGYRTFQRSGMDVDLWFRLMERFGSCVTITKPLFGKRLEPNSIIFNPQTILINQIPRVLAMQRRETGLDDYQRDGRIDLDRYVSEGLVVEKSTSDTLQLSLGAWASCLMLGDFYGCSLYWKQINSLRDNSTAVFMPLISKIISRLRNNPYRKMRP